MLALRSPLLQTHYVTYRLIKTAGGPPVKVLFVHKDAKLAVHFRDWHYDHNHRLNTLACLRSKPLSPELELQIDRMLKQNMEPGHVVKQIYDKLREEASLNPRGPSLQVWVRRRRTPQWWRAYSPLLHRNLSVTGLGCPPSTRSTPASAR